MNSAASASLVEFVDSLEANATLDDGNREKRGMLSRITQHNVLHLAEDQYMNEEDIFFVASDTADVEQKSL